MKKKEEQKCGIEAKNSYFPEFKTAGVFFFFIFPGNMVKKIGYNMPKGRNLILAVTCSLFLSVIGSSCNTQSNLKRTDKVINSVKNHFVPDTRVAIFEVRADADGNAVNLTGATSVQRAHDALKDSLSKAHISFNDHIRLLPDTTVGAKIYAIVNNSVCNIRTHPEHPAELSTQSTLGTLLKVYDYQHGWYRVQTPDHYLGWVDAGGITPFDSAQALKWIHNPRVIFTEQVGFAYNKPDVNSLHVSDLVEGNILEEAAPVHRGDKFVKVRYPDGREAYVSASSVEEFDHWLDSRNPTVKNVITTAKTFMGEPYLWGGTSPKGFDCSGFTKTTFYMNGVILPRDANQQAGTGKSVPADTSLKYLQAGDLLFFGHRATETHKERIVHVALYLGDGKFINSSGSVKIESLRRGDPDFNEYRLNTLLRARRLFPIDLDNRGEVAKLLSHSKFYLTLK